MSTAGKRDTRKNNCARFVSSGTADSQNPVASLSLVGSVVYFRISQMVLGSRHGQDEMDFEMQRLSV
jgi:hypothetical protein